MFWLSYECFSILCNAFLLKSAISSHNSCTGTNQNIICCQYFPGCYLFVSLRHCSHMSLSYLSSDDGLIFFCFSFCGALGLLLCLKSKKQKVSDSLPSLMGSYHKSYLHAYLCQNFWVNGQKFGLEGSLKMMLSMGDS